MEKAKENYDQVIAEAIEYLKARLSRSDCTLKRYQSRWGKVKSYMDSHNISEIDASICSLVLHKINTE